ncbi:MULTISPECIES: hypothetical protein [unclassified Streptomyces]|uniref:hypothetical protein n=1 Tax=Streptomyces sp. NPDC055082 TaxID=3365718 RepID=UPI0037D1104B
MEETTTHQPSDLTANSDVRVTPVPGLDPDAATLVADDALAFQIGTTTRRVIERQAELLKEQIEAFSEAGLPEDVIEADQQREEIRALFAATPTLQDPAFSVHTHMRALGRVLRRHLGQYQVNQEGEGGEPPALAAWPDSERPREMYRVPSGLAAVRPRRWLSLTIHGSPW